MKIKAAKYGLGIGIFRHGRKILSVEIGKRPEKNSDMVGNFPQSEKKRLPVQGAFSIAAPVVLAGIYLLLFISVTVSVFVHDTEHTVLGTLH